MLAAYRKAIRRSLSRDIDNYEYVFILAHMRSGSTLLAHILASHPEFVGVGETHTIYKGPEDLPNLVVVTCQRTRKLHLKRGAKYVVDQINHDEYLAEETFSSPRIHKCVILIRSPEGALPSMMSMFEWQDKYAAKVYTDRLEALIRYGLILGERALLVEYDDLVDRTAETLTALTNFFGVSQSFSRHYATHRTTEKWGDPSGNIWTGHIIKTPSHKIDIGADVLAQASLAFQNCRQRLLLGGVRSSQELLPALTAGPTS
jgi:hypothetical protein